MDTHGGRLSGGVPNHGCTVRLISNGHFFAHVLVLGRADKAFDGFHGRGIVDSQLTLVAVASGAADVKQFGTRLECRDHCLWKQVANGVLNMLHRSFLVLVVNGLLKGEEGDGTWGSHSTKHHPVTLTGLVPIRYSIKSRI